VEDFAVPDIRNLFPKKYLDEPALGGRPRQVRIASVAVEQLGNDPPEHKPVLHFAGLALGLVLNKTNSATIAATLGFDTDRWLGATLELRSEMVQFRGQFKPAIRVRVVSSPPGGAAAPPAADQWAGNGGAAPTSSAAAAPAPAAMTAVHASASPPADFDDEIPW
jgi:hypothetical protein